MNKFYIKDSKITKVISLDYIGTEVEPTGFDSAIDSNVAIELAIFDTDAIREMTADEIAAKKEIVLPTKTA